MDGIIEPSGCVKTQGVGKTSQDKAYEVANEGAYI